MAAGRVKASSFRMPGAPIANWIVLGFLVLIAVFLGIDPDTRVALYVAPVWFAILALGYRLVRPSQPAAGLMQLPPGPATPAVDRSPMLPEGRAMTVTFAAIEEARRCIAGAVAVTPASPRRPCRA